MLAWSDPRRGVTVESLNQERTVYLIGEDDADGEEAVEKWVKANYRILFEDELEGWYTDPELWPKNRTLGIFRKWFAVEYHSVIVDTVGGELYDDDA